MATVTCLRCKETREGLEAPPTGGELGKNIQAAVCANCWSEWTETSARLINHYGLVLGNPEHRTQLRSVMKQFLGLEPAPPPHEHAHEHGHEHQHEHGHQHGAS